LSFAGLSLGRPIIMGIVNVTPDSFSDGGDNFDTASAVAHGLRLIDEGAHIIDVGGESTRPGAKQIDSIEELARVRPVVRELISAGALVSIDTRHAKVMEVSVDEGVQIINDVSALTWDPSAIKVAAQSGAHVILMHMKGTPQTMTGEAEYDDVVGDVIDYLAGRIKACADAGIAIGRISVDPGFGFAKNTAQNFELLDRLDEIAALGRPVTVGLSRKFGKEAKPKDRTKTSLSLAAQAAEKGASIFRVHEVAETISALNRTS